MPAPHRSSLLTVQPEWIDFNGHLNMAYYNVLFDRGADELFAQFGFGPEYAKRTGHSTFSAEFHVCYLREVHEGDQVYVTSQLLDFDEKRFHFFQELHHEDGWLSASTSTCLARASLRCPQRPTPRSKSFTQNTQNSPIQPAQAARLASSAARRQWHCTTNAK
jgi:acyl-CoA thioester hydrolase